PSIGRRGVPSEFDTVIAKGMAKNPDARYPTTLDLANAARAATTVPISRPPSPPPESITAPARAPFPPTPTQRVPGPPGPPGRSGFAPPPVPAQPRRKVGLIVGAAAAVILVVGAVIAVVLSGSRQTPSTG